MGLKPFPGVYKIWFFGNCRDRAVDVGGSPHTHPLYHGESQRAQNLGESQIIKAQYNSLVIELTVPGRGTCKLEHLVCDVNGTLAVDGKLLDGIARSIAVLKDRLQVHLVTADTHGRQDLIDEQLNLKAHRLHPGNEAAQKAEYVRSLGAHQVVALGQGANDALMLEAAALGICILSPEGTATAALLASDLVVSDIFAAFHLLEKPLRIVATLRT